MITTVIDIFKYSINLIKENKKEVRESKDRISTILNDISNVLNDTADKLSKNVYPSDNCIIMERLMNELLPNISPYFTEEQSNRLGGSLNEVIYLEKLYNQRQNPDTIESIKKASGEFKSMSIILKF